MAEAIDRYTLSRIVSGRIQELDLASFSPADWQALVLRAQADGVGPLVYWALSQVREISSVPRRAANSLRAMYFSTKMHNEQMVCELESLVSHFDRAGITVVALKGICFALTIYPDLGLRPMADLDLLVPAAKLSQATRLARTLGYAETAPDAFPGLSRLLGGEISLKKIGAPYIMLELHNSLLQDRSFTYAVPVDWFWEHTEPLQGTQLPTRLEGLRMLAPDAQVLYAAAHAVLKHGGGEVDLRWLYDLDRLLCFYTEQDRLDWRSILSRAKAFQWSSALEAALSQSRGYFESPIPGYVLRELSNTRDRHYKLVMQNEARSATRVLEEYQNLLRRKWYGRVLSILGLIVPSPAYMRWRYGLKTNWSLPAWYLRRWRGMLKDMLLTTGLFVRRKQEIADRHMPGSASVADSSRHQAG